MAQLLLIKVPALILRAEHLVEPAGTHSLAFRDSVPAEVSEPILTLKISLAHLPVEGEAEGREAHHFKKSCSLVIILKFRATYLSSKLLKASQRRFAFTHW